MITGFKLRVTSKELREHCQGRSVYHSTRAEEKESKLPGLKEAMNTLEAVGTSPQKLSNMGGKSSYHMDSEDPVDALEKDIRDHRNKSLVFRFFGDHLFDEDYTLDENDLNRLEILKR